MNAHAPYAATLAAMALQAATDNGRSSEGGWFSNPAEQARRTLIDALIELSDVHMMDRDFADLLKAYRLGNREASALNGNPEGMREFAQTIRDEAERVADRLEQAAEYAEAAQ